jgi:histidine triad (HIT) family protein
MSTDETNPQNESIFAKIIRKEIPAEILYEDEHTLAFLDIAPNTAGHTLVIPKKFARNIFDVDQETLAAVMETVRKISPAVRDAVGAKGVHINSNHEAEAGQLVFHLHFHIIPRHDRSEFEFWPKIDYAPGEAAIIAQKIRSQITK